MTAHSVKLRDMRVYALLTEEFCRRRWRETAELLLAGGADVIQLREKHLPGGEFLARAKWLKELTADADALLIINDRPDIAALSGADGVHLGQDDLPPTEARKIVGPDAVVGWSTASVDQALRAAALRVDYIGVGPVYPTATKGYTEGGGPALVAGVCERVDVPTVAIGGITAANAGAVVRAGATAVAACAALCGAVDPAEAVRELRRAVVDARRADDE